MSVRVNILYLPGTNCHRETMAAFRRVGGQPSMVFISDLIEGRANLADADVICLAGGFSYGDHVGAGNVAAWFLKTRLADQLELSRAKPMICICNGFQIAARAGIFGPVSLAFNESGTFRDEPRQRHVVADGNDSFWLDGLHGTTLEFPCAHGEGRFVYDARDGWETALTYPRDFNPDGSQDDIAGVTTPDGNVLGLMNHPERSPDSPHVLDLFLNAVKAVRD
jgi:phosphoribosylformylglycinamidine synthase subunit PurQ / glutaminase